MLNRLPSLLFACADTNELYKKIACIIIKCRHAPQEVQEAEDKAEEKKMKDRKEVTCPVDERQRKGGQGRKHVGSDSLRSVRAPASDTTDAVCIRQWPAFGAREARTGGAQFN